MEVEKATMVIPSFFGSWFDGEEEITKIADSISGRYTYWCDTKNEVVAMQTERSYLGPPGLCVSYNQPCIPFMESEKEGLILTPYGKALKKSSSE